MIKQWITGLLFSLLLLSACGSDNMAGGTSEETNTIAGVLLDSRGSAVAGAVVEVRSTQPTPVLILTKIVMTSQTLVHTDTTDAEGRWAVSVSEYGQYGVVAARDSLMSYQTVLYSGKPVETQSILQTAASLKGSVRLSGDSLHTAVVVSIPGTPWSARSDQQGSFLFEALPPGDYSFVVSSPDPARFVAASYFVAWKPGAEPLCLGPLPVTLVPGAGWEKSLSARAYRNSIDWVLPVNPEYGLQGWWTFDYYQTFNGIQEVPDVRGRSGTLVVYGNSSNVAGLQGYALRFNGPTGFGVVENDRGVLANAKALSVEAWINLEKEPDGADSIYNLFGKLTDSGNVLFSLALVKGACGSESVALAMFLNDGVLSGFSCAQSVVAAEAFPTGQWVHTAAVWDGDSLVLYQNGIAVARKAHVLDSLLSPEMPVYFGKSGLTFQMDEVRWGTEPLQPEDVFYRYRMFDQTEWAY